jgi:hypothetical protein
MIAPQPSVRQNRRFADVLLERGDVVTAPCAAGVLAILE